MKNKGIRIFDNGGKTCDRYSVAIADDVFSMSENANLPNGVCMYLGKLKNVVIGKGETERQIWSLPKGVRIAIGNLLKENE